MPNKSYLAQIDDLIEDLQDQIDDLAIAKRVIERLNKLNLARPEGTGASGSTATTVNTTARPEARSITTPVASIPVSKKPITRGPFVQKILITNIRKILSRASEPVPSSTIITALEAQSLSFEVKKQRVWAALSVMKKAGELKHDADNATYMLKMSEHNENTTQTH